MTSPISITTLAELASAGVLRAVQLVGQVGGYTVMVRVGQTEKQLTGQRGDGGHRRQDPAQRAGAAETARLAAHPESCPCHQSIPMTTATRLQLQATACRHSHLVLALAQIRSVSQ